MSPITLRPDQGDGFVHFSDMQLRLFDNSFDYLTADVVDIKYDPSDPMEPNFMGILDSVVLNFSSGSPFINDLTRVPQLLWTGPGPLIENTDSFTQNGESKFATAVSGVPEPSSLVMLLAGGLVFVFHACAEKAKTRR